MTVSELPPNPVYRIAMSSSAQLAWNDVASDVDVADPELPVVAPTKETAMGYVAELARKNPPVGT